MCRYSFLSRPGRLLVVMLIAGALGLGGCSSGGSTDTVDSAMAQNQKKIDSADVTARQEADASFLVKTTSNALLEVELGKLAQARATAPVVRTYGSSLVQQRLKLLANLRALAATKGLTLPTALGEDEQAAYHEASTQTGSQLDKHVVALLVKTQKQDEDGFDDMSDDAYDGDIRSFAAKNLDLVQDQLASAKQAADILEELP